MTAKKRPSWKSIKQQRQTKQFVGREEQLTLFQDNLTYALDDDRRKFIFNIWGQGGIGKTTLTKKFRKLAQDAQLITTYSDQSETDVPAVMARFSAQMKTQGHELKQFDARYKLFRQKQQELESDPDAPQGFASFAAKTATKASIVMARRIPGAGGVFDLIDEEFVAEQAGEWTEFVRKRLTNKDEVHLLLDPEKVLTPLFLAELHDLAEKHDFVLFFDTYERTCSFVDAWLLDMLDEKFGELPANFTLCIAGRHRLERNKWIEIEQMGIIADTPLTLFSTEEAKNYLQRKGIDNEKVIHVIVQLSGRLPLLVEMLASGIPDDPEAIGEPSGHAVERFLLWVEEPQQRQFALDAALLQELNRDTVTLLTDSDGDELFNWLLTMPFIEERAHGWMYHDVVRTQMLRYKRRDSAQSWRKIHGQLATHYAAEQNALQLDNKRAYKDEAWKKGCGYALYHRLCQAPQTEMIPALHTFLDALAEQKSFARHLATIIEMAGTDSENEEVRSWGEQLAQGLDAYDANEYDKALTMFTRLLQQTEMQPTQKAIILSWRGNIYRLQKAYDHALADFDTAIQINPTSVAVLNRKALVYKDREQYENALVWFDKALDVDPEDESAWAFRGLTHRLMKQYEAALADLDKALDIDPEYTWALRQKGLVYKDWEQYENALVWFDKALDVDPEYELAWAFRGLTHRLMKQYDAALADLDKALELDPDDTWALRKKGVVYQDWEQYENALVWFDKALEVDPEDKYAWANRGLTHRLMKQYEAALADLDKALGIDPDHTWALFQKGLVYKDWEQYKNALVWFDKALELDPDDTWNLLQKGVVYKDWGQYENALVCFDKALAVDPEYESAWAFRGLTHRLMKQYEAALADLDKAIELAPDDRWNLRQKGLVYKDWQQYENGLTWFDKALAVDPEDKYAWAYRGWTHRLMKQYEAALADLDKALELAPDDTWNLRQKGLVYIDWEQYENALVWFDKALAVDPEDKYAWANRGWTHRLMKQYEAALADLDKVLELDPEYDWALRQRGTVYLLLEKFEDALKDLTKAVTLDEKDDGNYFLLAIYYLVINNPPLVQTNLEQAFALIGNAPESWTDKVNFCVYTLAKGNLAATIEAYHELLAMNPPNYAVQNAIADIDFYLDFFPENGDALTIKKVLQAHLTSL